MDRMVKNLVLIYIFFGVFFSVRSQSGLNLNTLSEQFLLATKTGAETIALKKQLELLTLENIVDGLPSDVEKKAFWINVYNAFILDILSNHPELYDDKDTFFSKNQIHIAGTLISFDKIEHGILRRSQSKVGLGYVGKLFPGNLEKKLRVAKLDYRIHFALNCGAKDCPPVAIYAPEQLDVQLQKATHNFLASSTFYDETSNTATVTRLFSWFRGDFGGIEKVKKLLLAHGLVPNETVALNFKEYDWELDLGNFAEQ